MGKAFQTGEYTNLFAKYGYQEQEINDRLALIWQTLFFGKDDERIYNETDTEMGYVVDTGNNDVRTEGMSYAMMLSVQLDQKEVFDRLWKWTKTYMWMDSGVHANYSAWSVSPEGVKNAYGPAPDGEEYFAMALFFASHRWGDGRGIFQYSEQAKDILHHCIHKGENNDGFPMWNPENKLIKFIPEVEYSDPSYHLPHFYELFSIWANDEDCDFWKEAAEASRNYLLKACHPATGLTAEYADYDGNPYYDSEHFHFYSDSYRVAANIGLDYEWFGKEEKLRICVANIQKFFCETVKGEVDYVYAIDGTKVEQKVLHPVGLLATNAMASLATEGKYDYARECVEKLWNTPLRTGNRRYYDNFLYSFAFLALSGNFRIW